MTGATMFSGICAPETAAPWIDWKWRAEIEPFPCAVAEARHPGIPNLGDVTRITKPQVESYGPLDIVVFGSPCQDLSVAGKRAGLKGERSGLFFTAMDIVRWSRARFALWENVPGAFSSNGGRDFAAVVGAMVGMELDVPPGGWANTGVAIGPDAMCEWCVLDAQFFGVPQRRRRVFALRDSGDWANRPPILFDAESLSGNPAPSREAGKGSSSYAPDGPDGSRGGRSITFKGNMSTPSWSEDVSETLHGADAGEIAPTLRSMEFDESHANGGGQVAIAFNWQGGGTQTTLGADAEKTGCLQVGQTPAVAFQEAQTGVREYDTAGSLRANGPGHDPVGTRVRSGMAVRRLTPRECERLQGFPDDYTLIQHRGKPAADGPRYKALGNSMARPVMAWILERIRDVDAIAREDAGQ